MTREEASTILEAIRAVTCYPHETQYDCGPRGIDEKGINVLNAVVRGLIEEDDF